MGSESGAPFDEEVSKLEKEIKTLESKVTGSATTTYLMIAICGLILAGILLWVWSPKFVTYTDPKTLKTHTSATRVFGIVALIAAVIGGGYYYYSSRK